MGQSIIPIICIFFPLRHEVIHKECDNPRSNYQLRELFFFKSIPRTIPHCEFLFPSFLFQLFFEQVTKKKYIYIFSNQHYFLQNPSRKEEDTRLLRKQYLGMALTKTGLAVPTQGCWKLSLLTVTDTHASRGHVINISAHLACQIYLFGKIYK